MTPVCRKRNATPSLTSASTATRRAGRVLVRIESQSTRNTAQPVVTGEDIELEEEDIELEEYVVENS